MARAGAGPRRAPRSPPPTTARSTSGRELAADLAEDPPGLPDLPPSPDLSYEAAGRFEASRRASSAPSAAEDGETHYDLGVAYREMGLLRRRDRRVRGRDERPPAAEPGRLPHDDRPLPAWSSGDARGRGRRVPPRARATAPSRPRRARALHYELSPRATRRSATSRARSGTCRRCSRADPRFRDARAIAARLGGGPGRPPPGRSGRARPTRRAGARANIGFV